jgi:hypothetical protein
MVIMGLVVDVMASSISRALSMSPQIFYHSVEARPGSINRGDHEM